MSREQSVSLSAVAELPKLANANVGVQGQPVHGTAAAMLPDILPPVKDRRGLARFFFQHPTIALGGALLVLLVLLAILAPWLGTGDPSAIAPARRNRVPSAEHWFGTDAYGKDIYARVI